MESQAALGAGGGGEEPLSAGRASAKRSGRAAEEESRNKPKLNLKGSKNEEFDIQLKVFDENKEEDLIELSHRLSDIGAEMDDINEVYNLLYDMLKDASSENYFLPIPPRFLLIRNGYYIQ